MRFDQHGLHRPTQRVGHERSVTKAHDQVGTLVGQPEGRGELWPHRLDFNRLVHKRIADAQCRGLQRKALVAAADFDPVRLVGGLADEYRHAGRAANLPRILVILSLWLEQETEGQFAQPGGYVRVPRGCAVEPVALVNRVGAVESNPGPEFPDECRVGHLGGIGLQDVVEYTFNCRAPRDQQQSHTA
jgi:hypothetical protein